MRKMAGRILLLTVLLPAVFAAQAMAQVAVPEIYPGGPRLFAVRGNVFPQLSFTPENPAAMLWGAPSRIGGGTIDGDSNDVAGSLASDFSGSFGGFRLVGNRVAVAVEQVSYSLEKSSLPQDKESSGFALAFGFPEWIAFGLAAENRRAERFVGPVTDKDEIGSGTFGLSLNLGGSFFIGLAMAEESRSSSSLGVTTTDSRPVTMAGLGFRSGGDFIWHLEVSTISKDVFEAGDGTTSDGFDLTQAVLEMAFWNLIIAVESHKVQGTGTADTFSADGYTADFGYAPLLGITITGRLERSTTFVNNVKDIEDNAKYFTLTWQF